jgi:hypothetical protein
MQLKVAGCEESEVWEIGSDNRQIIAPFPLHTYVRKLSNASTFLKCGASLGLDFHIVCDTTP